ncbi:hypothetical protein NDU88_002732 [Pleurodeles waltl]|uniref:Uncharacterized protein n=1 Tax=Pleurodeles waltl TaxID=8319 RepID=A0AAV7P9X9_PLEWA|nr:hypothetical protein NDU88_002732 [Pleurodeles waltl]
MARGISFGELTPDPDPSDDPGWGYRDERRLQCHPQYVGTGTEPLESVCGARLGVEIDWQTWPGSGPAPQRRWGADRRKPHCGEWREESVSRLVPKARVDAVCLKKSGSPLLGTPPLFLGSYLRGHGLAVGSEVVAQGPSAPTAHPCTGSRGRRAAAPLRRRVLH